MMTVQNVINYYQLMLKVQFVLFLVFFSSCKNALPFLRFFINLYALTIVSKLEFLTERV